MKKYALTALKECNKTKNIKNIYSLIYNNRGIDLHSIDVINDIFWFLKARKWEVKLFNFVPKK